MWCESTDGLGGDLLRVVLQVPLCMVLCPDMGADAGQLAAVYAKTVCALVTRLACN